MFTKYSEIFGTWSMPNAVFISNFEVKVLIILKDVLLGTGSIVSVSSCYVAGRREIQRLKTRSFIIACEHVNPLDSPPAHSQACLYTCWPCSFQPFSFMGLAGHGLVEDGIT